MNWIERWTKRAEEPGDIENLDPTLQQALKDFKASVHTWSEAEFRRARRVRSVVVHKTWRLAGGLSLATALIAATISGQLYERHVRQMQAQAAAAREAEHQRQLAAEQAKEAAQQKDQEDEDLASIDSAISREVPAAMEPLAALSEQTESQ